MGSQNLGFMVRIGVRETVVQGTSGKTNRLIITSRAWPRMQRLAGSGLLAVGRHGSENGSWRA
ncbi:hypothetical protein BDV32DRAFT_123688 [Aspergillus pseudonomiae]|nr:hypothetical protein BDV32DRAFT_123688 [Aspergillus pseudonomiae]